MIEGRPRRRGEIDADLVLGLAKLEDAETPDDVPRLLSTAELNAILSDPRGFDRLMSLGAADRAPAMRRMQTTR